MAESVKCLSYKHKGLFGSPVPHKNQGAAEHAFNPYTKKQSKRIPKTPGTVLAKSVFNERSSPKQLDEDQ